MNGKTSTLQFLNFSLVGVLSERSVAEGNRRVDIPDVSGGSWNSKCEHPVFRRV